MRQISMDELTFIRQLFCDYSGIVLDEDKGYLVVSRLGELCRKEDFESISAMIAVLRCSPSDSDLIRRACEALLIAETSFFRDIHPFEVLKSHVLPALIAKNAPARKINIWCAACATGQEPFSIAMLIKYHFPILHDWNINIVATDLSHQLLERAKKGQFNQLEVGRGLPAAMLVRYFSRQGLDWFIDDDIQQMVTFEACDLTAHGTFEFKAMDVIFIRNVLIYFDIVLKKFILHKIKNSLHPEGYMFLGGAESTVYLDDEFTPTHMNKTVFYRLNRFKV